ncbi:hypothetical protein PTI98_011641 [Pleurotus ostreatus]|nr:hypothetical protein PTI98_011641 [Pleurotus ostreatus]
MDNMEYYYLSTEAAKIDKPTAELGPMHRIADMDSDDAGVFAAIDASFTAIATGLLITDDDIKAERLAVYTLADQKFMQQAMAHAYNGHVFEDAVTPGQPWMAIS